MRLGPLVYLLWPFRIVVRPYLAADSWEFLKSLGPSLLMLGLHFVWVVRSNVAFEEASVEASRKMAERVAAIRAAICGSRRCFIRSRKPVSTRCRSSACWRS